MNRLRMTWISVMAVATIVAGGVGMTSIAGASAGKVSAHLSAAKERTKTPIQHLVVIFDENVSFDHYFATYPYTTNPSGEPQFTASPGTPAVNNLVDQVGPDGPTGPLLTNNGNESNPIRLDPSDAMTCDQDHGYTAEQLAADHGAEDLYAQNTGNNATLAQCLEEENTGLTNPSPIPPGASSNYAVMDYYDGNSVTALWNYAQHFSMSDNAYGTTYGPSTPGALNVTAAQTYGSICGPTSATINDGTCSDPPGYDSSSVADSDITTSPTSPSDPTGSTPVADQPAAGPGTTYSDADPYFDICSYFPGSDGGDGNTPASTLEMGGNNIGEELTSSKTTWGWFEGGFDDGYVPGQGTPPTTAQICSEDHNDVGGKSVIDYIPHHEPFQYYASTANPMHLPPTSVAKIGHNDQADHQYDIADFWAAADTGNLPAVLVLEGPRLPRRSRRLLGPTGRADLAGRHDQPPRVLVDVELDSGRDHVGRLRWLVRPRARDDDHRISDRSRRSHQHGQLRIDRDRPDELERRCRRGQVRGRPTSSLLGHLALCNPELGEQHSDRPELDREVHRIQLGTPCARERSRRSAGGFSGLVVRLPTATESSALPQPVDRRANRSAGLAPELVEHLARPTRP